MYLGISAINPVATPYELVHYLGVAGASTIFAEEHVLTNVEKALELSGNTKIRPTIAILGDTGASQANVKYQRV